MMDVLTRRRMESFGKEYGFVDGESQLFERYIAYAYLDRYLNGDVKLIEEVVIGGGNDGGVDIVAIIVNGAVMTDPSDVDEAIAERDDNTIRIVFIQAKTGEKFDTKLMSKFLHGIEHLTNHAAGGNVEGGPLESGLANAVAILDRVFEEFKNFNTHRIPCDIYYVNTATRVSESALQESQVLAALARLETLAVYEDGLRIRLHGSREIAAKLLERSGPQKVQFLFPRKQSIPETEGVEQAYIGIIQASELVPLLTDDGGIRVGIFDDNVRLYQGDENTVNQRIYATLNSENRGMFPFLNNGITIIARELSNVADRFTMSGYQIVNGGQTSHQIARWAAQLAGKGVAEANSALAGIWVPLKIVTTKSPEILSEVTIATNLQTAIAPTDIQSSSQDAKDVEEYFSRSGDEGLRYERQSGSASSQVQFPKLRVVTTPDLNRAVSACIFGESSRAIGSPKELNDETSQVWGGHPVPLYYYSAWIVYRVERYFGNFGRSPESDQRALKAAKYHIAMLVSAQVVPEVRDLFSDSGSKKNWKSVGIKAEGNLWQARIDKAIDVAITLSRRYFSAALMDGSSLRKDDVRARKIQSDLLEALLSRDK